MTKAEISGIAPFFIVKDVPLALSFYRDRLGFDITFQGPSDDDIFFGIVQRGAAMIMLKAVGVNPVPNYTRDIKKGIARWDAYLHVPDPDALAAEFSLRNVEFFQPLMDNDDGLRGFEVKDADGYLLYFGRPRNTAAHYDQFFGPMFFEPYAIEVVKRMDPTSVSIVLEIAAGTGRVTRHIRERIPASSKLIASDISEDMLGEAKTKLGHLNIEWQNIDAQQLPFSNNSIDLVVCCFAYMFVPDKPKAFAEAYRVLRPGGMFLFTTWDKLEENAASYTSRSIAKEYLEEPLPESYNLAASMSDETVIGQLLQDAGFSKITIEKVKQFSVSPSAKEAAYGLVEGGGLIYKEIEKRNPAWIAEIKIKLEKELAEKFGAAPMIAPISAVISQAWK